MKTLILFAVLAVLSGCAQTQYEKLGATQESFAVDKFDCKERAFKMTPTYNGVTPNPILLQENYQECMQSKGYRTVR